METKFIPTLQAGNGYTYLKLKGILDEDNLLSNLLSQIQGRLLLIDMAEIERINSCGVRDWVNWNNQIQALGIAVILLRCSPVVVSQANMVTNFAADAFIHSFYAPYVHPDTGEEQSVLLFTEEIRKSSPVSAPKIFNENGEELEFDEFEESYFAFIGDPRIKNYQVSPDVQAVIQYYLPEAATRQPVVGKPSGASVVSSPVQSYGGQGGYGGGTPSGMMNSMSGMRGPGGAGGLKGGPGGGLGAGPGYGAPMGGPRPMSGANFPMPAAAPPLRHEQPPLPSSGNYQQPPAARPAPPSQALPLRSSTMSSQGLTNSPAMNTGANQSVSRREVVPAPSPTSVPESSPVSSEPRPAPQPVSPLAAQSMARQKAVLAEAAMAEDPAKPIIATNAKGMAPATVMSQKAPIIAPSGSGKLLQNKNFLIILAIGGAIIIALIIALIIVVTNGKS
ncbi:MAG: hypothetical protein IJ165_14050 [Proteobacteria bacterium]|nr:hypothetical protein [Pseudomonadota bacterium]